MFARDLFELLSPELDITLFKGGGLPTPRELVIDHVPRQSPSMAAMRLPVADKWHAAAEEVERMRVEGETFAYASLRPLLEGGFDVVHCLEQEVCRVLWAHRHLFARTPKLLWSNGGALPAADIPPCDAVQEHTAYNLRRSARHKAFLIPHGVDVDQFRPGVPTDYRQRHGIPADAFVAICVGTICYWHKRTDHVIREMAALPDAWLVVVGQEGPDTPAIKALGQSLMPGRIVFDTMPHDQLPQAYAAADAFVLGSLFETFGIVYIEAMAMGLPVFCTHHPNQREIVGEGVFVDMEKPGELTRALRQTPPEQRRALGLGGRQRAEKHYGLASLKQAYFAQYERLCGLPSSLPAYGLRQDLRNKARGALRWTRHLRQLGRT